MVDFSGFPVAKIVLGFAGFLVIFVLSASFVHYSVIENVVGCDGLSSSQLISSCKKEITECAELPTEKQRSACVKTAVVNSGLVLGYNERGGLFIGFLLLVLFVPGMLERWNQLPEIEKDIPREPEWLLRQKIISQKANAQNNYLKNLNVDFETVKRSRGGFAHFSNTGVYKIDGKSCVVDPRKGIKDPVLSPIRPMHWFESKYGKDTPYGKMLASREEIIAFYFPLKEDREKQVQPVVLQPQQVANVQTVGGDNV